MTRPGSTGSDKEPDVEISVKSFEELTKAELYALLRLREFFDHMQVNEKETVPI